MTLRGVRVFVVLLAALLFGAGAHAADAAASGGSAATESAASAPAEPASGELAESGNNDEGPQGLSFRYGTVDGAFRFFGDAGAAYEDQPTGRLSFLTGSVDAFTTVKIGDHIQVLSEIVGEFDGDTNEGGFEMERYWAKWSLNDAFYAKLGREHDPVNHWNRRFHHGRIFWPAVSQPFLARFEDQGGPLPIHAVGLEMGGTFHPRVGDVTWITVVSNGRGLDPTEVVNARDHNASKAWDVGGSFAPSPLSPFTFGANYREDKIPADPVLAPGVPDTDEKIASAFVEEHVGRVDLLAEYADIRHDNPITGDFNHQSWYVQVNVRCGKLAPFARVDVRNMALGDPYYIGGDLDLDRREALAGLRVDLAEQAAFKFEIGYARGEERDSAGVVTDGSSTFGRLAIQWMF